VLALIEENEKLRDDLEDCVFAGLCENNVSDTTIKRKYEDVCEAIDV
jgi:hypothetical protein